MFHLRQTRRRPMGRIRPENKNRRKRQRRLGQFGNQKILLQANATFKRGNNRRSLTLLRRGRKKKRSPKPILSFSTKLSLAFFLSTGVRRYQNMLGCWDLNPHKVEIPPPTNPSFSSWKNPCFRINHADAVQGFLCQNCSLYKSSWLLVSQFSWKPA